MHWGLAIAGWLQRAGMLLVILLANSNPIPLHGAEVASIFEEGNRLYEQGNYSEAIKRYETLLQHGVSPQVFFNLGNARFRNGDVGLAIASYRRAQQLAPRDADLRANLKFARQTVPGAVSVVPGVFGRALDYFTLNEIAAVLAAAFWIWLGLRSLVQWQPGWRSTLRTSSILAAAICIFAGVWLAAAARAQRRQTAIVIVEQASARFGPLEESQPAFTANDGAELLVLGRKGDWVQVEDRSGRPAWIREEQITLFP